ncbi:MAG: JAB domain-containing protein [Crocinitomicaceae bacterium]|nr:JAB domain-containing protein [Crocinitomicaceae bacterium]
MNVELSDEEKIRILNGVDLFDVMQKILKRSSKIDQDKEHFWIVGLSTSNEILFIELVSLGTKNSTSVDPMEVFSFALQKRAVQIVLVHNHPSGTLRASDADKDMTDRLIQVGIIVDLPVYDHLIITDKSYYSFKDSGLLEELSHSLKYVPPYVLEARYKKEAAEMNSVLLASKIAMKLLKDGMTLQQVSDYTELSIEEIRSLERGE